MKTPNPPVVSYGYTNLDAASVAAFPSAKAFADSKMSHPDFTVITEDQRGAVLEDLYKQAKELVPGEVKEAPKTDAKGK